MIEKRKKEKDSLFVGLFLLIKFVFSIPFYILNFLVKLVKKIIQLTKKSEKIIEEKKVKKKREKIPAVYSKFKIVKETGGNFDDWEKKLMKSDSTIGIILGARGSGKTAIAIKTFENIYRKTSAKLYAIGFKKEALPSWIEVVDSIDQIKNNAHVLIDEGGILFNSRESMSKPNKLLSDLMLIARHKNLSILFISQNSSNLEVNILRQADYLILKPSSLLQKSFERKIIMKLYEETSADFKKFKDDKGLAYLHSDDFTGFISNSLPSFWNKEVSKSWEKK